MGSMTAVQQALYDAVTAALAPLTPSPPLYDQAPAGAAMPFVEISRHIVTPDHLLAKSTWRVQTALTVYSAYRGQKEVLSIMDAIRAALDDAVLPVPGFDLVRIDCDRFDTARDADGLTYMGSLILTTVVEEP